MKVTHGPQQRGRITKVRGSHTRARTRLMFRPPSPNVNPNGSTEHDRTVNPSNPETKRKYIQQEKYIPQEKRRAPHTTRKRKNKQSHQLWSLSCASSLGQVNIKLLRGLGYFPQIAQGFKWTKIIRSLIDSLLLCISPVFEISRGPKLPRINPRQSVSDPSIIQQFIPTNHNLLNKPQNNNK